MKRFWLCVEIGAWTTFAALIGATWLTMLLGRFDPPFALGLPVCLVVAAVANGKRGGSLGVYGG